MTFLFFSNPRLTISPLFSLLAVVLLAGCGTPPTAPLSTTPPDSPAKPAVQARESAYAEIPGWQTDDLREAWPALLANCEALARQPAWKKPCAAARKIPKSDSQAIRRFFESHFVPVQHLVQDGDASGLMTGYYEPLLRGARARGGVYQTPLHGKPDDLLAVELSGAHPELKNLRLRGRLRGKTVAPYPSRAEIRASNLLAGKELLWVDDPVDAFFLQVQGSGRVKLADTGETVRVAYADQNGHPYKSIGRYLIDKRELLPEQASAQQIKAWIARHPDRLDELLDANPSYVFFKVEKIDDPSKGPKGSLGVALTPERSVAVDPVFIALGTPVFISVKHPASGTPIQRLAFAQDTGSAITGPNRIDYFWGFGEKAGEIAGKTRQRATIWLLMPRQALVR